MPNIDKNEELYSSIKDLAKDSKNLFFQLITERILKFDLKRTLEINTFFLNYFLIHIYFPGFDITNKFLSGGEEFTEEQQLDLDSFKKYIEITHGLFIMVPMIYKMGEPFTPSKTDFYIERVDIYGDFVSKFFYSHENVKDTDYDDMEEKLKGFSIIYRFLPDLEFDPEFLKIVDSKAVNQLYYFTYPRNYLDEHGIQRYIYPVRPEIKQEYDEALRDWDKKLFSFNHELVNYTAFLKNAANYVAVLDYGSTELIAEVINLFTQYYSLRVPDMATEIGTTLQYFEILFELARGRFYKKVPWNVLTRKLSEINEDKSDKIFLDGFCMTKTDIEFPNKLNEFNSIKFISRYYDFLKFAGFYYMGYFYTGALLIWRAMMQYFEDLQRTLEFRKVKGDLLENWALEQVQNYGFPVEKLILRNKNLEPTKNYHLMLEQVNSFNKEPIILEAEFIDHQRSYSFHEIDLVFRVENTLFLVECKGRSIPLSKPEKFMNWANLFLAVYDLLTKKTQNLGHIIEKDYGNHPLFKGLADLVPIIIQTEGVISHEYHGFTTSEFIGFLEFLSKEDMNRESALPK